MDHSLLDPSELVLTLTPERGTHAFPRVRLELPCGWWADWDWRVKQIYPPSPCCGRKMGRKFDQDRCSKCKETYRPITMQESLQLAQTLDSYFTPLEAIMVADAILAHLEYILAQTSPEMWGGQVPNIGEKSVVLVVGYTNGR